MNKVSIDSIMDGIKTLNIDMGHGKKSVQIHQYSYHHKGIHLKQEYNVEYFFESCNEAKNVAVFKNLGKYAFSYIGKDITTKTEVAKLIFKFINELNKNR